MSLFIILILMLVLAETTVLWLKSLKKPLLGADSRRKIYVDTSVLMDGRILSVAESGFLNDTFIIPRSVLRELQLLADSKESEKRARARYGLDIVSSLERATQIKITILYDELDRTPVDDRLLELAKSNHGWILTNDFNLNKVATAEGIPVLNINNLAMVLRGEYLPGEHAMAKITTVGSNARQGIGHLPDGTMLVVENASNKVGKDVEVEFVRVIQTAAGKMVFAKIIESPKKAGHASGRSTNNDKDNTEMKNTKTRLPKNSREAEAQLLQLLEESGNQEQTAAPKRERGRRRKS